MPPKRGVIMRKGFIIGGIIFLVATVILIIFGFHFRSMFYGIMDAPYSVYGKYGTYARICFIVGIITGILTIVCFVLGMRKQ